MLSQNLFGCERLRKGPDDRVRARDQPAKDLQSLRRGGVEREAALTSVEELVEGAPLDVWPLPEVRRHAPDLVPGRVLDPDDVVAGLGEESAGVDGWMQGEIEDSRHATGSRQGARRFELVDFAVGKPDPAREGRSGVLAECGRWDRREGLARPQ